MTVIVDDLFQWSDGGYRGSMAAQTRAVGRRNGHRWCHMTTTADDTDYAELHAFAARMGLRRSWFQGDHYDLTPGRRAHAVKLGAKEVSGAELSAVLLYDRVGRERPERLRKSEIDPVDVYAVSDDPGATSGQIRLF